VGEKAADRQPVRRMKTYAGAGGYVFQYYFVGKRQALPGAPEGEATEYVFDVSADRKSTRAMSVFLPSPAVAAWGERHGRSLSEAERYAAAKMRLLRGFDEMESLSDANCRLSISAAALEELLAGLGVD
jgi:hypothetical protein